MDTNSSNKRKFDDDIKDVYVGTVVKCVNKHIPYITGVINILCLHLNEGNLASLIACYISCDHVAGKFESPCPRAPFAACPKMGLLACIEHCGYEFKEHFLTDTEHRCDICFAHCGDRLHDFRMYDAANKIICDLFNVSRIHVDMGQIILDYAGFGPFSKVPRSTPYHRSAHGDGRVIVMCSVCSHFICEECSVKYIHPGGGVICYACNPCMARNPRLNVRRICI